MFDETKCERCGDCLVRCKYVSYDSKKAVQEITALIEGKEADILKYCITCIACNEYCKQGANPFDLISQRQEEGGTLYTTNAAIRFMDMGKSIPTKIIKGEPDMPVLSLCVVGDLYPQIFKKKAFEGMTIIKGRDYYCHLGYVHTAREGTLRDNLFQVVDNLSKISKNEIIFFHDDCYSAFTTKAKEYGIDIPFKPVHIIEYLRDYMREHRNEIRKLNMKVAYQRPCASRYTLHKDLMLDELFELIGVDRVSRNYDGIDALCCGGPLVYVDKNKALEVQKRNLNDARDAGAEAMAFLCPVCSLSLKDKAKESGLDPYMIIELCNMALEWN